MIGASDIVRDWHATLHGVTGTDGERAMALVSHGATPVQNLANQLVEAYPTTVSSHLHCSHCLRTLIFCWILYFYFGVYESLQPVRVNGL